MSLDAPFRAGPLLPQSAFERVRRRAMFEAFKWDDVSGDEGLLCPFPILVSPADWQSMSLLAEALAAEALAAEAELLARPDLHASLGLPADLTALLSTAARAPSPGSARVTRFDFHPTPEGLRITESNCDVASGYVEASGFGALLAELYPDHELAGDPAGALAAELLRVTAPGARIGLLHLTTYSDDHQIMCYLAKRLDAAGLAPVFLGPEHLCFRDGAALARAPWCSGRLDAVFRFLPAQWLPALPPDSGHGAFCEGAAAELCNPGYAVLTHSKRFPLVWDRLASPLQTWRSRMPETISPEAAHSRDGQWVQKPALGFEGVDVAIEGAAPAAELSDIRRRAMESPGTWAAQRRFESLLLDTPLGPMFACLGIYVIGGKAAGAYARLSRSPRIDRTAREAAVFLERPS
jgi:glutathionylspermidine synthase